MIQTVEEALGLLAKLSCFHGFRENAACLRRPVVIALVAASGRSHLRSLRLLRAVILHFTSSRLVQNGGSSRRLGFRSGMWRLVLVIGVSVERELGFRRVWISFVNVSVNPDFRLVLGMC